MNTQRADDCVQMIKDLEDDSKTLTSINYDLRERVHHINSVEPAIEIHAYCDDKESEVLLNYDTAIEHLNKLKNDHLEEIASYRSGLLQAQASATKVDEWTSIKLEIADLVSEIEELYAPDTSHINQETFEVIHQLVQETKKQADEYMRKVREIGQRVREKTFEGRFMAFNPNKVFTFQANHLGRIEYRAEDFKKEIDATSVVEKPRDFAFKHHSSINSIQGVYGEFNCFGYADGTILIRESKEKGTTQRLRMAKSSIVCMHGLTDGMLAIGCEDGSLYATGLKRLPTFKYPGHSGAVFSIKRLKERTFASMSTDNTIKIWTYLFAASNWELLTIHGHDCTKIYSNLGVLSNYYLVTCSDDLQNGLIRIWSPDNGKMVRELESKVGEVVALTVLSNDDIVVGSKNGTIRLINLYDESLSKTLIGLREKIGVSGLAETKSGFLVVAESSEHPNLQVWDPRSGKLIQSLPSKHKGPIKCLYVTTAKTQILTSASDNVVKAWNMP